MPDQTRAVPLAPGVNLTVMAASWVSLVLAILFSFRFCEFLGTLAVLYKLLSGMLL